MVVRHAEACGGAVDAIFGADTRRGAAHGLRARPRGRGLAEEYSVVPIAPGRRRRGGAAARRLKAGRDGGCHRIAQGRRTPLPPCLVSGAVHASGAMPPCQPARAIPRAFSVSSTAKRTKSTRPHAPKVCLSSASSASKGRLPTKTRHELHACVAGGAGLQWHPHAHGLWLRSSSGLGLGAGDRAPGRARLELGPGLGFGPRC